MIVVAGEALVDLIVGPDGSISAIGGGSSFNVARAIARLGVACGFLSCLSDDLFGRMLRTAGSSPELVVVGPIDPAYPPRGR